MSVNSSTQTASSAAEEVNQHQLIKQYYRFQSRIYDATRWAFLFGRLGILRQIPFTSTVEFIVAEIGCGTGFNLARIARKFPQAELVAVDVSADMLSIARKKLAPCPNKQSYIQEPYGAGATFLRSSSPDLIIFSYALTMINPQWKQLIQQAYEDLPVGGKILVADFHNSDFSAFKKHMANHHVRMDSHLLPELKSLFVTRYERVKPAYGGMWHYFMYLGEKA